MFAGILFELSNAMNNAAPLFIVLVVAMVAGVFVYRSMNSDAGDTHAVGEAEFQAVVLDSDMPVLVDFTATWCGPSDRRC